MSRRAAEYGFRRRCSWCGRVLRSWQLNSCRTCKRAIVSRGGGPPFVHGSQWDAEPDSFRAVSAAASEGQR